MNDQQCALVVKEALVWSVKHAPEATDAERAMFARGAVFGFRAGEATYRNWPSPAVLPEPVDVNLEAIAAEVVNNFNPIAGHITLRGLVLAALRRVQPFDAKTDTYLLQKARQFAAESNICLTADLVEALVGFVRKVQP